MTRNKERYELDDLDRELLIKVRRAVINDPQGEALRDHLDDDDLSSVLRLLLDIVASGSVDE